MNNGDLLDVGVDSDLKELLVYTGLDDGGGGDPPLDEHGAVNINKPNQTIPTLINIFV